MHTTFVNSPYAVSFDFKLDKRLGRKFKLWNNYLTIIIVKIFTAFFGQALLKIFFLYVSVQASFSQQNISRQG